jgi:hypothetical protein
MTAWAIRLPHRGDRSAPLATVSEAARFLPQDDDREVCRQLVMDWRLGGLKTVGDALDLVAALEPAERRRVLNHARKQVGLPTVEEVEAAQPRPLTVRTVNGGGGFTSCAVQGCNTAPTRAGIFYSPDVNRWHCDAHAHLAGPHDLQPRRLEMRLSPSGVPVDDPAEDERDRAREESRAAQLQAQAETRAVEAAEAHASNQARDAAHRQELPEHFRRAAG